MCVCGWQLLAVAVIIQLLVISYGEIESRLRSEAERLVEHRCPRKTT